MSSAPPASGSPQEQSSGPQTVTPSAPWAEALRAAALIAVDPGLGGAVLKARAGPIRDAWLDAFRAMLDDEITWRRIPANAGDDALLGGIDLASTLKTGRPVRRAGLLEEIGRGVGILAMAERADAGVAARLGTALESAHAPVIIALDEAAEPEEGAPPALIERLAFCLDLSGVALGDVDPGGRTSAPIGFDFDRESVAMARVRLPHILNAGAERALTETAAVLGIDSLRPPLLALRAARAAAAFDGFDEIGEAQAALAARLVLAPRARRLPAEEAEPEAEPEAQDEGESRDSADSEHDPPAPQETPDALTEITTEAARAAIPSGLLTRLEAGKPGAKAQGAGRAGAMRRDGQRGRPVGARRGDPSSGQRLDVMATLRAAAPWGRARRRGLARFKPGPALEVRREDFRVKRFRQKAETATIFVVDASGSLALNRLAEAKGAVELMLGESYVRRDQVALIAFRGSGAETLLAPTRSLTRAKRSLAALPGGGGTPLASAIEAAEALAHNAVRQGRSVSLIFLTDGAANVTRDGTASRERAQAEALDAARRLRAAGHAALVVDVSRRGAETALAIARDMDARYVRLPAANPGALASLAREAAA